MSEASSRPLGQLFTDVYRDKGALRDDSEKFRVQLFTLFSSQIMSRTFEFTEYLKANDGLDVMAKFRGMESKYSLERYVLSCSVDDLLDWITHAARFFGRTEGGRWVASWVKNVRRAVETQNLAYEVDDAGGMHHKYDQAFSNSKALTLSCLSGTAYQAAHEEIEKAFNFLTQACPDTKLAVVNAFLAAENLFKLAIKGNNGLSRGESEKLLKPVVQRLYAGADSATQQASGNLVSSFGSWADACHPYRHGQQDPVVTAPPIEIGIALVTAGADYIRWLAELAERNR
jgi:hypothetical protein